jgi:uncharacterized protein (UPF0128 family)
MSGKTYQTTSPVLFIIYNRPDLAKLVFAEIKKVKPEKLYLAADGPSAKRTNDIILCNNARAIINEVDWNCEVKTLFRDDNAGCKVAVSSAISWFFENEEMGIILEDDCVPDNSFFYFCDTLLAKYKTDTRIRLISGCNLQNGHIHGDASYYFSNLSHVWGWASWRRVWKEYKVDLSHLELTKVRHLLENIFNEQLVTESWVQIISDLQQNKIDTWDYQFALLNLLNNGLSVIPNMNLIKNIGFRADATHTNESNNKYANLPTNEMINITHPLFMTAEKKADQYTLFKDFNIAERKNQQKKSFTKRIKSFFR